MSNPPRLTPHVAVLLTLPPLLWALNAVLGRWAVEAIAPMLLNALRWVVAFLLLLPLGWAVFRRGSGLWASWRYFAWTGLLGIGCFNALQYLALHTSSPINVTLITASMPVWMLLVGVLGYGQRPRRLELLGVALSFCGVLWVLSQGDWRQLLGLRWVPGDVYMLVAIILWALYSWQLARPAPRHAHVRQWPWAWFLLAQVGFGTLWALAAAGVEWGLGQSYAHWSPQLWGLILFVAIGPSLVAFRSWGVGVAAAGPALTALFSNLTPAFAALFSGLWLGQPPAAYHAAAFALIVAGIVLSSRQR